jgi:hypothetical protein
MCFTCTVGTVCTCLIYACRERNCERDGVRARYREKPSPYHSWRIFPWGGGGGGCTQYSTIIGQLEPGQQAQNSQTKNNPAYCCLHRMLSSVWTVLWPPIIMPGCTPLCQIHARKRVSCQDSWNYVFYLLSNRLLNRFWSWQSVMYFWIGRRYLFYCKDVLGKLF